MQDYMQNKTLRPTFTVFHVVFVSGLNSQRINLLGMTDHFVNATDFISDHCLFPPPRGLESVMSIHTDVLQTHDRPQKAKRGDMMDVFVIDV